MFKTNEVEKTSTEDLEYFKALIADKEKELEEKTTKELPLSAYSTTQLKAELRRRKTKKKE